MKKILTTVVISLLLTSCTKKTIYPIDIESSSDYHCTIREVIFCIEGETVTTISLKKVTPSYVQFYQDSVYSKTPDGLRTCQCVEVNY